MKKIYSLVAAVLATTATFAQAPASGSLSFPNKKVTTTATINHGSLKAKNATATNKTAATNSGWFNYGSSIEALTSATSDLNANYLFPDSMGYGDFGGTPGAIWIHHLAEMVDFKS